MDEACPACQSADITTSVRTAPPLGDHRCESCGFEFTPAERSGVVTLGLLQSVQRRFALDQARCSDTDAYLDPLGSRYALLKEPVTIRVADMGLDRTLAEGGWLLSVVRVRTGESPRLGDTIVVVDPAAEHGPLLTPPARVVDLEPIGRGAAHRWAILLRPAGLEPVPVAALQHSTKQTVMAGNLGSLAPLHAPAFDDVLSLWFVQSG